MKNQLEALGHKLTPIQTNLIEIIWTDRPKRPSNAINPLGLQFSGMAVKDKFNFVKEQMAENNAQHLVLTNLDEIAWFLNLRGSDIPFNPVFFSYAIINLDSYVVYLNPVQTTQEIKDHLAKESGDIKFKIENYESIEKDLTEISKKVDGHIWLSNDANYALCSLVPKKHLMSEITPIQLMKAIKNPVEIKGMRNAHIKDAAALCTYFNWLEQNVASTEITEVSGAEKLEQFRAQQADFMGPSFETISSVGPHGAIIHYKPTKETDQRITNTSVYLCDSGGQYRDGTTDVTRTLHFGTPTDYEKECYTRVLKGQLKLGSAIFPTQIKGNYLDTFAREFLWQVGLDYAHGTGHGIGSYLNVHEGPMGISWRPYPDDPGLQNGMFLSNEPGYYEDGKFGLRIEDIVQIVQANTPNNFNNRGFLTFETITLVPKTIKLIKVDMLTKEEINQLNHYHQTCRDIVGPVLEKQGQLGAKDWLWKETEPIGN